MPPPIRVLVFDAENESHLARHRVTPRELRQLFGGRYVARHDDRGRDDRIVAIGRTAGGRALTVVVEYLPDADAWRPITAWDAGVGDRRRLGSE